MSGTRSGKSSPRLGQTGRGPRLLPGAEVERAVGSVPTPLPAPATTPSATFSDAEFADAPSVASTSCHKARARGRLAWGCTRSAECSPAARDGSSEGELFTAYWVQLARAAAVTTGNPAPEAHSPVLPARAAGPPAVAPPADRPSPDGSNHGTIAVEERGRPSGQQDRRAHPLLETLNKC